MTVMTAAVAYLIVRGTQELVKKIEENNKSK